KALVQIIFFCLVISSRNLGTERRRIDTNIIIIKMIE
ncbi:unnamed protein product, partial [Brassica rapa subsp. trilocularis]